MDTLDSTLHDRRSGHARRRWLVAVAGTVLLVAACNSAPGVTAPPPSQAPASAAPASGAANTTGGQASTGASTSPFEQALAYSACMRSHGVPKFPDPVQSSGGGISLQQLSSSGIDPNSPQFKAAQQACQHLMPAGAAPGGGNVTTDQALQWASCMRSHGVPNLPDPTVSNGVAQLNLKGTGISGDSSQFQSAAQACNSLRPASMMVQGAGSQ